MDTQEMVVVLLCPPPPPPPPPPLHKVHPELFSGFCLLFHFFFSF